MSAPCIVCSAPAIEGGRRLCGACARDVHEGGEHGSECRCGPCNVVAKAIRASGEKHPWGWPEVEMMRDADPLHLPEPLAVYLARREAANATPAACDCSMCGGTHRVVGSMGHERACDYCACAPEVTP